MTGLVPGTMFVTTTFTGIYQGPNMDDRITVVSRQQLALVLGGVVTVQVPEWNSLKSELIDVERTLTLCVVQGYVGYVLNHYLDHISQGLG